MATYNWYDVTTNQPFNLSAQDDLVSIHATNSASYKYIINGLAGADTVNFFDGSTADYKITTNPNGSYQITAKISFGVTFGVSFYQYFDATLTNVEYLKINGVAWTELHSTGDGVIYGTSLNDTLNGTSANDALNGGVGNDTMIGGKGNDTYYVNATGDVVTEAANAGTDTIISAIEIYTISALTNIENLTYSGSSDATLTGNKLTNTLTGSTGNDSLSGGLGNDSLIGGAGNDVFIFDTTANASKNKDTITDFISGTDHIQFNKAIFTGLGSSMGNLTEIQFYSGAGVTKAHDTDDRIIYNSTTGALYYDADGSGKGVAVQVALIGTSTHPSLAYTDIAII